MKTHSLIRQKNTSRECSYNINANVMGKRKSQKIMQKSVDDSTMIWSQECSP